MINTDFGTVRDERDKINQAHDYLEQAFSLLLASNDRNKYRLELKQAQEELIKARDAFHAAGTRKANVLKAEARLNAADLQVKTLERQIRCLDLLIGNMTSEYYVNGAVSALEAIRPYLIK